MLAPMNATPSHLHIKRIAATVGSEFVVARICTVQIIELRYTLMYPGVPLRSKKSMLGDNKSVADSASIPTSTLSKKSTLASYQRVRESHYCRISPLHLERYIVKPLKHPVQTLGICKYLASLETPTFLEGRYKRSFICNPHGPRMGP